MKKRNRLVMTGVTAALAAMQICSVAMAKETNNSAANNNGNPDYDNVAHTTFGVIETDKDVSGQVSFEVPLYVTMAAVANKDNMLLPTDYAIENTSGSIKDGATVIDTNPIGVTSIKVQTIPNNTWSVVAKKMKDDDATKVDVSKTFTQDATGDKQMTFTLGGIDFAAMTTSGNQTLYDNTDGATSWKKVFTKSNTFVKYQEYAGNTTGLAKIGRGADKLNIDMESLIKNSAGRKEENGGHTTGVFKVMYTLAKVDANGQPQTAAVYAGDNWTEAGYSANPSNKKN